MRLRRRAADARMAGSNPGIDAAKAVQTKRDLSWTCFLYGRGCQDPFWPGSKVLGCVDRFGPVGEGGGGAQRFLGPRRVKCRR